MAAKKAAKKKSVPKPKGPFYIYIVLEVPPLSFEANENIKDKHKLDEEDEVLKLIIGGLVDMKACEKWLREHGMDYNGERIVISHQKVDKILKLKVRTTLGFE